MMRLGPAGRPLALLLSGLLAVAAPFSGAAENAVDFEGRVIRMVLPQEPPQLDSSKATDQVSTRVLGHVMEALTRFDGQGRLVPGVAERWEIRSDGATFWLRENARWSDGSPVTAADFVFSWRHAVDPKTASEYAFILQGIENAEAISQGEAPITSLGVSAPEPRRLEVRFSRALAYFDKLVAFATFYPLKESFYRARDGRYGADAEDMLFNGPFVIERWDHGARLEMAKNPHYWDRDNIYLNRIEFPYITADTNAALNLFKDNRIILAGLDSETMENALDQRWRIERFNDGSAWYIEFNHREGRLTQNWHLRRALALSFDTYEFINRVIGTPGNLPGLSLYPSYLQGAKQRLLQEIPPPEPVTDWTLARSHLEKAMAELGLTEPPELVLLTGNSPTANKQAEFLQTLWKDALGLTVRIDRQIFKQRLAKMTAGDFDLVAAGWGPDYLDPLTFGDLFASWNLNNRGRYANPALDACVRQAQNSVDPEARVEAFGCIQRILLDDHAIIPTYERGQIYVIHPAVKGAIRRQTSPDPDLARSWLEQP